VCEHDHGYLPRCEPRRGVFHGDPTRRFPRYAGVEIECGSSKDRPNFRELSRIIQRWGSGVHDDGSVNTRHGMEIVTAPACGDALVKQITEICDELVREGGIADASCGLHVHVDARDLATRDVLKLLRVYRKVEPGLYEIVAPSRRGNHFSRPWGDHFMEAGCFKKLPVETRSRMMDVALYGSEAEAARIKARPTKHHVRYHGLNLNSILLHGTIEFRLHHGTVNKKKILMWAGVCMALVNFAKRTPETKIASMTGTPFEILCEAVKDKVLVDWMRSRRDYFLNRANRALGRPVVGDPVEASER
jgi:hypothetical protein